MLPGRPHPEKAVALILVIVAIVVTIGAIHATEPATAPAPVIASAPPPPTTAAAIGSAAMTASAPLATPASKMTFDRTKKASPVVFNHEIHSERAKCQDCHAQSKPAFAMGRRAEVYPMKDMYEGTSCGTCHNGTKAFSAKICGRCHGN